MAPTALEPDRTTERNPMATRETLDASVVIATRDRARSLAATLSQLRRQLLPDVRWEVVVVDNASTDDTPSVLSRAAAGLPLVRLHEPRPGKNRALNAALAVVRGELVVLTDDDVIPRPDWLRSLLAASHRWPDCSAFGGRIVPRFPSGTPEWLREPSLPWSKNLFSTYAPADVEGFTEKLPVGPNLAIRAPVFAEMRFDESLGPQGRTYPVGGETALLERLQARGHRFVYVPSALVEHVVRPEQIRLRWLLRRVRLCGRGDARRRPDRTSVRLFAVPRHHWRELVTTGVRHALRLFRNDRARFETGRDFYVTLGRILEYRELARVGRESDPSPHPEAE